MRVRISALDPKFPPRLRYPGGPTHMEAMGALAEQIGALRHPIAIVGTRHPSQEALHYTFWLSALLARAGATIVSGGALGIDTAAHQGALSEDKATIAVLPTSVDNLCPASNAGLFKTITEQGALVGFRETHEEPRFHERNAAIAALVDDVIMVAAPLQSGARNTAAEARKKKRNLWVVPGAPWDPTMAGCAMELTLGAEALISPQPILRALGLKQQSVGSHKRVIEEQKWLFGSALVPDGVTETRAPASAPTPAPRAGLPRSTLETLLPAPDERRLLEALSEGPASVDELVLRTALPVAPVRALLLTWSVEGVVREGPIGLFRLLTQ